MDAKELHRVLTGHSQWWRGEGGQIADLRGANLRGADLRGADLDGANLDGAKLNWQSHDLLAEILRRATGGDVAKRKIAGLVLISREFCWKDFFAMEDPLREWALNELAKWVQPNDDAPAEIRRRAEKRNAGE